MRGSSHCIWSTITKSNLSDTKSSLSNTLNQATKPVAGSSSIDIPTGSSPSGFSYLSSYPSSKDQITKDLISGYIDLVNDRIQRGWSCHLLTILFSKLAGRQQVVLTRMKDEIERIYRTFVTRINRDPRRAMADELPLLVGAGDLQVHKSDRSLTPLVICNGGLHCHFLLLIPPVSRLKESIQAHFERSQLLYRGSQKLIQRIHVKPVVETPERVVDYVLKTISNQRLSYDDAIILLPRARQELAAA